MLSTFIVYSRNGRPIDGKIESTTKAIGLSMGLMRDTGMGINESIATGTRFAAISPHPVLPKAAPATCAPAEANAPRPNPHGIWIKVSVPGIGSLA